jgi:type 1 glutamine amidotransferase
MRKLLSLLLFMLFSGVCTTYAQTEELKPRFNVLVISESGGHHIAYSNEAKVWLNRWANDGNFSVDYIENTDKINDQFLSRYQLFIQLDFVPYAWKPEAIAAFEKYIKEGRGGWIGFHHATLLGEFDGFPMWTWFSEFMGGIRYKNYIPGFAAAEVKVEDTRHPAMMGISPTFLVKKEEWYVYDKSPRPNVKVLASVNESTYSPDSPIKMGDHPVIWTNPRVRAKNIYIFMGHSPVLFESEDYRNLFKNAIFWAGMK